MAERTHKREGDEDAIAPLYARLPRGPHQMARGEVVENQRQRMHGAMVEAVAANGYGRTSVRQVVSLAGVSRRAFYEQFTNKQDCFLATLDLIAGRAAVRVQDAYRTAGPRIDQRMRAALETYADLVTSNPKSAHLVLLDAPAAGAPGWTRLTKMLLDFERLLAASFVHAPDATPLPVGVVRGMIGGLHRVAFARVGEGRASEMSGSLDEMLRWTLAMQSPEVDRLGASSGAKSGTSRSGAGSTSLRGAVSGAAPAAAPTGRGGPGARDERARLLDSALEMAAVEGYENLSPLRIVDHAGVSIDTFFSLFGDLETCFVQALARLAETVRAAVGDPRLQTAEEWPRAVRRALNSLMRHFARRPTYAHMVTRGAFEMGRSAVELDMALAQDVAHRLLVGAPAETSPLAYDLVAGAVWHTVYCHAVSRQAHRLPAVADQLAYVVLAPVVGAERALQALTGPPHLERAPVTRGKEAMVRRANKVGSAHL